MPTSTPPRERPGRPVYFMDIYDQWFDYWKYEWADNTYRKYDSVRNVIIHYESGAGVRLVMPIDKQQYAGLLKYLQGARKNGVNTVAKYSKVIRAVSRFWDENQKLPFLRTSEKAPPVISLLREELETWMDLPVEGWRIKARDLLVLQSMTGMRYVDTQQNLLSLINGNVLRYVSKKTKIATAVPLRPRAMDIIRRYNGFLKISNQVANREMKFIGRQFMFTRVIAGKQLCNQLSTHVGRKTFITLTLRQGIPLTYVMKMAGITNASTIKRYDSADDDSLVEAMAKFFI